jgi:GH15 family glucan-1,4-alpha-glucosidase
VAAATTSLPEEIGGVRNWDYRFCWLRDATFTLFALTSSEFLEEARTWRAWLLRAIAGSPEQMQILYGVNGERRLDEFEVPWLSGYENSAPVRIGNAASMQFQLMFMARWSVRCITRIAPVSQWTRPSEAAGRARSI